MTKERMQWGSALSRAMCALMRMAICVVLVFGVAGVPYVACADESGADAEPIQPDAQDASNDEPDGESEPELAPEEGIADVEPSDEVESESSPEYSTENEYDDASEELEGSQGESVELAEPELIDDGKEALGDDESEDDADGNDEAEEDEAEEDEEPISVAEAEELTGVDASGEGVDYVAGELLVTFADGTTTTVAADSFQEAQAVAAEDATDGELVAADIVGDSIVSDIGLDPVLSVPVAEDATVVQAMAQMMEDPNVLDVQPNYIFYEMDEADSGEEQLDAQLAVNDPLAANSQWGLARVDAYRAWNLACCDNNVAVAVIDSGCTLNHEDLGQNIVASVGYATSNRVAYEIDDLSDATGHGTHVAGIVSAVANNGIGVAGVSHNANLVIVKAGTASGTFSNKSLFAAYNYVLSHKDEYGIRVVNLSMGVKLTSYAEDGKHAAWFDENGNYLWDIDEIGLRKFIDRANDAGILTVCAACNVNSGQPEPAYPSDYDGVLSVMNMQSDGTIAASSNTNVAGTMEFTPNATKDICAPGSDIYSTTRDGGYGYMGGTSMAAPFVSGIAAMCFAAMPGLTPYDVMGILESSADDMGEVGWDPVYGYGCVNAYTAMAIIKGESAAGNPDGLMIAEVPDQEFKGSAVEPTPEVMHDGEKLALNKDYDILHADNHGVGAGIVIARGLGRFAGSITAMQFSIFANITKGKIELSSTTFVYDGKAKKPSVSVTLYGKRLIQGSDYTVSYASNTCVGTATVTVTGKGDYRGSVRKTFTIILPSPTLQSVTKVGAGARITWSKAAGAQSYDVYKRIGSGSWIKVKSVTGTSFTDVGNPGKLVSYRVYAKVVSGVKTFTSSASNAKAITLPKPMISYRVHVQNIGWQGYRSNGKMAGTVGRALRLEGIRVKLQNAPYSGGVTYRTHIQNIGWQSWKSNDALSGTTGRALRLEAIEIKLTGEMAKRYDVYYRVHCQNIGWMGWAKNGSRAGTAGYAYRLEGIEVVLVEKGGKAPGSTVNAFKQR